MKLSEADFPEIITQLDHLASQNGYTKIFAKIPEYAKDAFLERRYELEAAIPRFFNGNQKAYFLGKHFSRKRRQVQNMEEINNVLTVAHSKSKEFQRNINILSEDITHRQCQTTDILEITELYKKVFETYPFPIQDPNYIAETMRSNAAYFGIWDNQRLISVASADIDWETSSVEMTDFATSPNYRGKGFSAFLLQTMEQHVEKIGIKTAYTIARSLSYGMNVTFAKLGYSYSGTLKNNTNISGSLESMNVWYKHTLNIV